MSLRAKYKVVLNVFAVPCVDCLRKCFSVKKKKKQKNALEEPS
jgi:hypothetical protein